MPYSLDLRTKIVTAYETGKTSIRKVAKQFTVSPKTVVSFIKLKSRSEKAASEKCQQERLDYWQEVKDVKPEDLICIDETGVWEGI